MDVYNIAIVDSHPESVQIFVEFLDCFTKDHGVRFNLEVFPEVVTFLDDYKPGFDMVLMAMEMPFMDGIKAGRRLREMDSRIEIVFVADLKQYALDGYSVNALDFLLKPVTYQRFEILMKRFITIFSVSKTSSVMISYGGHVRCVDCSDILYVEVRSHQILYYLSSGEIITTWGDLSGVIEMLPEGKFQKCNKSCLVNLRSVRRIDGNELTVGDKKLSLARGRKNSFIDSLAKYLSNVRKNRNK